MRRFAVVFAVAMLGAGALRAGSIEVDFNPKAAFERYKTWAWAPGRDQNRYGMFANATARERLETVLGRCLQDAGLRPAGQGEAPDILVSYQGDTGTGKTVTVTQGGTYDGTPAYKTVQLTPQAVTVIVDLVDSSTSALAWRLYLNGKQKSPYDTPDKFWRALEKGMAKYPPSASARAKKARQLEKESR